MNKVVNERRGAIFEEEESVNQGSAMQGDTSGRSANKKQPNSLFGARSTSNRK